jgi:glycosyltransferase involved in cell wall biosynthesis
MSNLPKISIITVVYNAGTLIERTIRSVLSQTYPNIQYIIIDGASSDNTLAVIEKYRSQIAFLASGKDEGIYDAMNKGLKLATGDYVLFLNAGDQLYDQKTLSRVFSISPGADVYYGNTLVVNEDGKVLGDRRLRPPAHMNWKSLRFGMCVSHQSFIAKRLLCEPYDRSFKISSDIDWVIKVLKQSASVINTHQYISRFLAGGTSDKRRKLALKERFIIMFRHYGFFITIWSHLYILFRYPFHRMTKRSMT